MSRINSEYEITFYLTKKLLYVELNLTMKENVAIKKVFGTKEILD